LGILDAVAIEKVCGEAWPQATNSDELHDALLLAGAMTDLEINRVAVASPGALDILRDQKRVGRLQTPPGFWVATERWPMLQAIYPHAAIEPLLLPPESELKRKWERDDAVRELVRGRMEIIGPITATALADFFELPRSEIDVALFALEAEGFVLRGQFHSGTPELQWCDRRLLARIHRLTINRLRAEIQPVSIAEFQRFLLAWQRVDAEHRLDGVGGVAAVLELLDGYEVSAAAWEPEVLALRVKDYSPQWLDQLCSTGRIGWGRLTPPQNHGGKPSAPVRSSPVSLFTRQNLPHWFALSTAPGPSEYSPDTAEVLESLARAGALFFGEIVKETGLLPSRVEQALSELAAQGCVTADSFEGLRALLLPLKKRAPFSEANRPRRHTTVTSVEFAGRWSLLRLPLRRDPVTAISESTERNNPRRAPIAAASSDSASEHSEAVEVFARALLRRYGVVFRRLLERESLKVAWFELSRAYRRLEARGEIRGGHFVGGVSGEQFALPEAIGLLRSIRKAPPKGELIVISGSDPLNLVGMLSPGPRVTAIAASRIVLRDGVPLAALEGGKIIPLSSEATELHRVLERTLRVGAMPVLLRPYYA